MVRKSEGTPRKSTASRKTTAKQSNPAPPAPVTPIREAETLVAENGAPQLDREIEGEIRLRAYELYLERGALDGFDQEDWRQAEEEILARYHKEKSA